MLKSTAPGDAKNLLKFVFPTSGISTFVSVNKAHIMGNNNPRFLKTFTPVTAYDLLERLKE